MFLLIKKKGEIENFLTHKIAISSIAKSTGYSPQELARRIPEEFTRVRDTATLNLYNPTGSPFLNWYFYLVHTVSLYINT